jgi:hypothetical protein
MVNNTASACPQNFRRGQHLVRENRALIDDKPLQETHLSAVEFDWTAPARAGASVVIHPAGRSAVPSCFMSEAWHRRRSSRRISTTIYHSIADARDVLADLR